MKELTIEEKVKRYDEAKEKAAALYKASEPMSGCNVILETLFPELAESEDEKVRKALIDFFGKSAKYGGQTNGVYDKDILAWLEKQTEQKPTWSEEDEHRLKDTIYFLDTAKKHYASSTEELDACIDWLKSLRPHNR